MLTYQTSLVFTWVLFESLLDHLNKSLLCFQMKTLVGFSSSSPTSGVWNEGNGVPTKPLNRFVRHPDIVKLPPPHSLVASPSMLMSSASSMDKMAQNSCPHCPYVAACRANLLVHMRSHTGERPYACGLCDASFTISSNLKRHQRARHYDHWVLTMQREQDGGPGVLLQGRQTTGGDAAAGVGEAVQQELLTHDRQHSQTHSN